MQLITLSRPLAGDEPPTEFLIFSPGVNETSKGPLLFDADAAASVMASYAQAGVDVMIDLNHESLDETPAREDSYDARGWAKLQLREDGSLWAVDVKWTPDGAQRLREKRQRYISPAAWQDKETGRVTELINCAIVAMPATYNAPELIAASRAPLAHTKDRATLLSTAGANSKMDPALIKKILDVVAAQDGDAALALLPEIISGVSAEEAAETDPSTAPDPATAEMADAPVAKALKRVTNSKTVAEALDRVGSLVATVEKLEAESVALDLVQRTELVGELVKLGKELPATAWADPDKKVIAPRLLSEPLADLKSRVVAYRASAPAEKTGDAPPVAEIVKLSKAEQAYCTTHGLTPEQFAAKKASTVRKASK